MVVRALAAAVAALALLPASGAAQSYTERWPLVLDRLDRSLGADPEWDDAQGSLRIGAAHRGAAFGPAPGGTELANGFAAAGDGCSATGLGDVDDDGLGDVAIGCAGNDDGASDAGSVLVLVRNAANTGFAAAVELDNPFAAAGDGCGSSVALADINGDRRADVVAGCPGNEDGAADAGSVVVFTRNAANTGFDAGVELDNAFPLANDRCGASVAGGDTNADGRADVVVGCPGNDDGAGDAGSAAVFVRTAANTGFAAAVEVDNNFALAGDGCGASVAAGDVNADGFADLLLGCQGNEDGASDAGSAIAFTRNAGNTGYDAGVEVDNPAAAAADGCGASVAIWDVNDDAKGDLLLGCPGNDDGAGDAGSAAVFTRNAGNTGFDAGLELDNPAAATADACGTAVAAADANGDGVGDVALGCNGDAGGAAVFTRNAANSGFDAGLDMPATSATGGDGCGRWLSAGHVDGDARGDLVLGCPGSDDGASDAGGALVLSVGGTIELDNPFPGSDRCGEAVAGGDVDSDGRQDVVVGCPGNNDGAVGAGSVVVYVRSAANTGFAAGIELDNPSAAAGDNCGVSVATGDVNADGRDDVAMGCDGNDDGITDAGSAVVFVRNAANTGFDAGVEVDNVLPGDDGCGAAVAIADIDGDHRADLVLGCPRNDEAAADAGSVQVALRNAANTGFDTPVEVANAFAAAGDRCGAALAAADVNADSRADVVAGCPGNDDGASDAGSTLVLVRNAPNTGFEATVELDNAVPAIGDGCGSAVAAGDVNADGTVDVVSGCPGNEDGAPDAGSAQVSTRNAGNTGFDAAVELDNPAAAAGDACGASVAAGDANADGRVDVQLGCRANDAGASDAGSVALFTRSASNAGFDAGVDQVGAEPRGGDGCGTALAALDTTGEGRADAVLGCPGDDDGASGAGAVSVVASTSAARVASARFATTAVELDNPFPLLSDACGQNSASGDFNADGRDDVLIGCGSNDDGAVDAGSAVLFLRNAANTAFAAGIELDNPFPAADSCGSVGAGDVNGDGRDDVLMGCTNNDDGAQDSGSVVVFTRNSTNTGFDAGIELDNPFPAISDQCGWDVASHSDVNGDGLDDVVAACIGNDDGANDTGSIMVWTRNATNTAFDAGVELDNPFPALTDRCGTTMSTGDVNSDGRDDVASGCQGNDDGGANSGSMILFTRNATNTGFDAGIELDNPFPGATSDICGLSTALADVNGDGRADALLGCPYNDDGANDAGSVVVFQRNATNTDFDAGVEFDNPNNSSDFCGRDLHAGDVNVDGRADILLGCPTRTVAGFTNAGNVTILVRNAANSGFDSQSLDSTFPGTNDYCGWGMALGDVNGDARPDPITACSRNDDGATDAGSVNVYETRTARLVTKALNQQAGTVTAATVTLQTQRNGGGTPQLELSANGGVTWEAATSGVAHTFGTTGTSLRARIALPDNPRSALRTTPVVHDLLVSYTLQNRAPSVPVLVTPADGTTTTQTAPVLGARFDDPDGADTGTLSFQVCANATCTGASDPLRTGTSAAGVVVGGTGSWTTSPVLTAGTYYWRAMATDNSGATSGYSATFSFVVSGTNSSPAAPVHQSPGAGGTTADTTPTFTARFDDPDAAHTGTLSFEVCTVAVAANQTCAGAGGSVVASGSSAAGIANGANGTFTPVSAIALGTYHWHVRAQDNLGLSGPWSASWQLTIGTPTLTIAVDRASVAMSPSPLLPGQDSTSMTLLTISTTNATGYSLSATDESDTWGADRAGTAFVPDFTAAGASPGSWTAGTSGYWGMTVLGVSGGTSSRLAKWGAGTGTSPTDFANNLYAGLDQAVSTTLHQRAGYHAGADTVTAAYRANPSTSQAAGAYDATVTYTATANP